VASPTFNLVERPWIEVVDLDGRVRLAAIEEVFAEAAHLRCLGGDLPTQTFAILRLLLAILYRSLRGPEDQRAWEALWRAEALPMDKIGAYLREHRERFDLFHRETPFYQVAQLRSARNEVFGLERIIADVPNGAPYLTSRIGPGLDRISPAEAARWLVHCHAFDPSGIKTGAVGDSRVKNGKVYPQGTGACGSYGGLYLEGRNLRETLLLNLIPYDTPYLDSLAEGPGELPPWERPPSSVGDDKPPLGRIAALTWQTRRVRLVGDQDGITHVLVCYGDRFEAENALPFEPMTAWRRISDREKAAQRTVYVPRSHIPGQELWRGLDALLPQRRQGSGAEAATVRPPAVSEWLAQLVNDEIIARDYSVWTHAVGVSYGTQDAVIDQVYDDRLALPADVFRSAEELRVTIVGAAADAEAAARAVGHLGRDIARAAGGSGDALSGAEARAKVQALSILDREFRAWLVGLAAADRAEARAAWHRRARDVVERLGRALVAEAGPIAWIGRQTDDGKYLTTALAELWFRRAVRKALPLAYEEHSDTKEHQEVMA
jgi:CRISPR system Cascade subunit CasA